jgi:putative membrane-bound dehydrogenase-like protein
MRHLSTAPVVFLLAVVLSDSPAIAGDDPPTAAEAAAKMTVPKGFKVTLFAGEPHVQQPIAFEIDDRGRLWVGENYTYQGNGFTDEFNDRIIVLEDGDQDGRFDKRSVFWDQGKRLSGITLGFGGVWALNFGKLIFIPDQNGDDQPDGEPVVLLDGFDCNKVGHNIVSGLMWGPDGWLYGRHGIQAVSHVGAPGTPKEQRTKLQCAIWRFHPTKQAFEIVCEGTTNPWGLDYDLHGELFFSNNVNGHLWHVVPGAYYKRMSGQHFNPHLYDLIGQTADHNHWDTSKEWHQTRYADANSKTAKAGGGHSHCGAMIYLGDNWPAEHRGRMFMCNTHGRSVNVDILERQGVGYVGKHAPDFLDANQPWFRGIEMKYGPDGAVYLADWTDRGECHDTDGVHRSSGRIYKIAYGEPMKLPVGFDMKTLDDRALLRMQFRENAWYARHARRILMERVAAGKPVDVQARDDLPGYTTLPTHHKLGWNWIRLQLGLISDDDIDGMLREENEHLRAWAVRSAFDAAKPKVSSRIFEQLIQHATTDKSGLVRLHLASALRKMEFERRWELAAALSQREEDANDAVQPLMIWYGIEPAVPTDTAKALKLAAASKMPKLRTFVSRRVAAK